MGIEAAEIIASAINGAANTIFVGLMILGFMIMNSN